MSHLRPTEANPFEDTRYEVQDPFADPAINRALSSTHIAADDTLGPASDTDPAGRSRQNSQRMEFIPLDGPGDRHHSVDVSEPRGGFPDAAISSREAELQRREQELAQRERELQAQSEEIRKSGRPPHNFPPFFPLMYLDIKAEIPAAHQSTVRRMWHYWLFLEGTLVLNCVTALIMFLSHAEGVTSAPSDFGVSFGYLFTVTFLSFFFWYRPIYNAFMKEKSLYYYFYFVFGGLHILVSFYLAVGIPYSGSAALINGISMLSAGKVVAGVFCLLTTACFLGGGLFMLFMYRKIHQHYKSQGHTFEEAKAQAVSTVASSKTAQSAATNYATSQFQGRA
ncbi:hypothetical protein IWQ60_002109 [Tieghemiomyces parasiticus]|uniref:Scamp-domain-containing protein n=1 Tax=Tieghemiomyces parasiticus TaxID=78921 RepID=A0A9W8AI32_9FUNG|nr:hypothetical protein IWQ60_002109 [Tieghemiomyces parasiticus]